MRIILLKSQSQYGVISHFIDEIAEGFQQMHYETRIVGMQGKNWIDALYEEINLGCRFILSINGSGINLQYEGESLFDYIDVPFICLCVDSPIHLRYRLQEPVKNVLFTFVNTVHVQFVKEHYHKKMIAFLPHGSYRPTKINVQKEIDLLFTGTYIESNVMEKIKNRFSPYAYKMFEEAVHMCVSQNREVPEALQNVLEKSIFFGDTFIHNIINMFASEMDLYVRGVKRKNAVKEILDAGLTLHCYGNGWEKSGFTAHKNFVYHKSKNMDELIAIMQKSKILLNILPSAKSAHERVFYGMSSGALCIADENEYFAKEFEEGKEIIFFKDTKELPAKIKLYLENEKSTSEITKAAYKKTMEQHTWAHRAEKVAELYEIYSLLNRIGK